MLSGLFFGTAFATILTPGPNMMYVATRGAERGVAAGLLAALAVVTGGVCYSVTTAIGLSAVMATHPGVIDIIKGCGIVYLVYLGIRLLLRSRDRTVMPAAAPSGNQAFRGGLLISLTNPQLALFFLAFLPQFVSAGDQHVALRLLELGLTFNCCSMLVMSTVAVGSGVAGNRVANVRFRQVMRGVAGLAFLALAVRSTVSLLH
ncbi:MAG TPA: LysE family translocator [Gemmatimonadales bacterium]|jgi:threonine/homoserine/homoserine lactone efflux protein